MSIESVMGRIAEIQGALAPPPAAAPPAPTAAEGTSFQSQLQGAMAPKAAAPGSYPHLDGDLDANPELLRRLEALAAKRGEHFHSNSGVRTYAEEMRLWNGRGSNPCPVAGPGTSRHESGRAAGVTIGGRDSQSVISAAELRAA